MEVNMRIIFMGLIWFIFFCLLSIFIAAYVISTNAPEEERQRGFAGGYNSETAAESSKKYGGTIVIGSLIVSTLGTATGVLPGTKRMKRPKI
jgi:uncharacterized membrane protein